MHTWMTGVLWYGCMGMGAGDGTQGTKWHLLRAATAQAPGQGAGRVGIRRRAGDRERETWVLVESVDWVWACVVRPGSGVLSASSPH